MLSCWWFQVIFLHTWWKDKAIKSCESAVSEENDRFSFGACKSTKTVWTKILDLPLSCRGPTDKSGFWRLPNAIRNYFNWDTGQWQAFQAMKCPKLAVAAVWEDCVATKNRSEALRMTVFDADFNEPAFHTHAGATRLQERFDLTVCWWWHSLLQSQLVSRQVPCGCSTSLIKQGGNVTASRIRVWLCLNGASKASV